MQDNKFKFIIPQSVKTFGKEEKDATKGLSFVDINFPTKVPDIKYHLLKVNGERKDDKLEGEAGFITLRLRLWDDKEYGLCLRGDSRNFWFITSMLRNIVDHGHYLEFKTSSGSTYYIEPAGISKEEFLELRKAK